MIFDVLLDIAVEVTLTRKHSMPGSVEIAPEETKRRLGGMLKFPSRVPGLVVRLCNLLCLNKNV